MTNSINWFEIPVSDLDRAQTFYENVLDRKLRREDFGASMLAIFPYDAPATGGCLQVGANSSAQGGTGVRIYLDCAPGIDAVLARVEAAGGQIVAAKSALPPGMGFIAHLRDTEGNEIGLHALS